FSRYYTVPVSGMSIVVGSYIALTINQIKNIHKKRNIFLTGVGILFITTIFVSYIGNISQITNQLSDIENNRNNVNYLRLWNTLQPYLNSIVVRDKKIVFYYEGSGTAEETKILTDYFPYRMAEEMSYTNGNGPTAAFINSKQTVLTIIKTEKLDPNQIYAFKIENGNVKDIKKDVLNEIAK
ncbi:MAG TPA: hypothetical protein VF185_04260, partial [Patescibacteria group bacterium]